MAFFYRRNSSMPMWSPCSKRQMLAFLKSKQSDCLFKTNPVGTAKAVQKGPHKSLPGLAFSSDQQCRFLYGHENRYVCNILVTNGIPGKIKKLSFDSRSCALNASHPEYCRQLWCLVGGRCMSIGNMLADGSRCSSQGHHKGPATTLIWKQNVHST